MFFFGPLLLGAGFALATGYMTKRAFQDRQLDPQLFGMSQGKTVGLLGLLGAAVLPGPFALISAVLGGAGLGSELVRIQVKDGLEKDAWASMAPPPGVPQLPGPGAPPNPGGSPPFVNPTAPAGPAAAPGGGWFQSFFSPFFDHPEPTKP